VGVGVGQILTAVQAEQVKYSVDAVKIVVATEVSPINV